MSCICIQTRDTARLFVLAEMLVMQGFIGEFVPHLPEKRGIGRC